MAAEGQAAKGPVMKYSVYVEAAGPNQAPPLTEDQLDAFGAGLASYSATVSGAILPQHQRTRSARLTIDQEADNPVRAAAFAVDLVTIVARREGLPAWPIVKVEVTEWERFCAELDRPNRRELVGVAELAALAGVTKQRASILARRAGFPDPVAKLAQGEVWDRRQVARFLEGWTRKPGRPARHAS
jgi:hypothetical protein